MFGDGQQTHDFVFVQASWPRSSGHGAARIMPRCSMSARAGRRAFCIRRDDSELCGIRPEKRFRPAQLGEIRHSIGSPIKARAVLDLPEPIGLREGLADVLRWMGASAVTAASDA